MIWRTSLAPGQSDVEELTDSAVGAWETVVDALPRVGIACGVDILQNLPAGTGTVEAMNIREDPEPEALDANLGPSTLSLEVLFWCDARQLEVPSELVALQATTSFAAAVQGRSVTPGGGVADDGSTAAATKS